METEVKKGVETKREGERMREEEEKERRVGVSSMLFDLIAVGGRSSEVKRAV